ncbi:glycerol acyltransferase [Marinilabiliaceae bacterium JC017]|nr:glycerol acyltransferase [Marinilabiliaceae bacterium JC017]
MKEEKTNMEKKLIDIDLVFASKNPGLYKVFPKIILRFLKKIVHQDGINEFIETHKHLTGIDYAEAIIKRFGAKYTIVGKENIPAKGRFIFASNHPLGGLDGMALLSAVGRIHPNIKFPVNDILMSLENLKSIFIPINKHGGHSREAARILETSYASEAQILMFPAGLVSRKIKGKIIDLEWKKNFVKKAIQHKRDIIPVHISGHNSHFFYNLANLRKKLGIKANIEMLFLPDELFKERIKEITITFGQPISWETLASGGSPRDWAQKIKDQAYALTKIN